MKACTTQVLTKVFASIFIQDKAFEFSGRQEHGSMPCNQARKTNNAVLDKKTKQRWRPQGDLNPCYRRERAVS